MIRVIVADDHSVVRQGIARILHESADVTVVGEAADATQTAEAAIAREADVIVLDLAMPGGGLDLVTSLHALRPKLRILVFTMHPEAQYAVRALTAGAAGFLNKGCPPDELGQAVRTVAAGRRYITDTVAELLANQLIEGGGGPPHAKLSNREYEVFVRLARGSGSGEIADELGLSVKTVSTYRSRVLTKLGVTRNADLTRYALEHDLLN